MDVAILTDEYREDVHHGYLQKRGHCLKLSSIRGTKTWQNKPLHGFGKLGCPPRIPAEAWTLFEIELSAASGEGRPFIIFF